MCDALLSSETTGPSSQLAVLRDGVFQQWGCKVRATIPAAAEITGEVSTAHLMKFFDEIVIALAQPQPNGANSQANSTISLHARERANSTAYGPRELLQELHLFRQTLFEVADARSLRFLPRDRAIIARTVDSAALEAMDAFAIAHKEIAETFIACLAHDLRNPLNVANASAQLIQAKSADDAVLRLARRVCAKLVNIDEMIGTLLDAMVVNGRKKLRLKIASFDMKLLVDEVAADMASDGCQIVCSDVAASGFWCRASMKRVLENLVSNAQKYGTQGSPIRIDIGTSSCKLVLSVHNDGPAIPAQEVPRLFSTFHRLADVDIKGWGLGLPLVQLVVASHGGAVAVASTAGDGTTFTIELPLDCRAYAPEFSSRASA